MSDFGLPTPLEMETELDRERVRYDPQVEAAKLNKYNDECPNTPEMIRVYNACTQAIDAVDSTLIIFIQGNCYLSFYKLI